MKLNSITRQALALQHVASTQKSHNYIHGVNCNDKHLVATDGHCMVVRKRSELDDAEGTFLFPTKTLKSDAVPMARIADSDTFADTHGNGITAQFVNNGEKYPDYMRVIDFDRTGETVMHLDAALLAKVVKAMDLGKKQFITLSRTTLESPIHVTSENCDTVGVIMPLDCTKVKVRTIKEVIE